MVYMGIESAARIWIPDRPVVSQLTHSLGNNSFMSERWSVMYVSLHTG